MIIANPTNITIKGQKGKLILHQPKSFPNQTKPQHIRKIAITSMPILALRLLFVIGFSHNTIFNLNRFYNPNGISHL